MDRSTIRLFIAFFIEKEINHVITSSEYRGDHSI